MDAAGSWRASLRPAVHAHAPCLQQHTAARAKYCPASQTVGRSPGLVPRVLNALCPGLQLLALGASGLLKVVCQLVLADGRKAALGRQGARRLRTAGVRRQRRGRGQCEAGRRACGARLPASTGGQGGLEGRAARLPGGPPRTPLTAHGANPKRPAPQAAARSPGNRSGPKAGPTAAGLRRPTR